jgi:hypothetical protein
VGAWINLTLLTIFARQQGFAVSGAGLRPVIRLLLAGAVLAVALYFGSLWLSKAFAGLTYFREETAADAPASKTPQPPDPTSASSSLPDNTPPPTV